MLVESGMDVKTVIERFEAATNGYELYADNPHWDGRWMHRLYAAAGHEHAPEVKDYTRLIAPYASGAVGQTMLMLAQAKADETAPRTHRAQDDAVHLATVYQLLLDAQ